MSAAYALQSEISSDPKHFPLLAPARMRLLHRNDIAYIKLLLSAKTQKGINIPPEAL
jgi:alpha-D-ribose 1-methylphosphonate 5-triphosphate synthase subunit PhnI